MFNSPERRAKIFCYSGLIGREQLLAEGFVVVGSRNLSALVVDERIHPINTEVGLFLSKRLEQERIQKQY